MTSTRILMPRRCCSFASRLPNARILLSLCIALLAFAHASEAGEVHSGISSRGTYVGLPVTLRIQFSNVSEHEPPQLPDMDGLEIKSAGTPSRSSKVTIINGQISEQQSITYAFEITPQREGEFAVPGITVAYDDRQKLIPGFRLVAKKSETGDLLDVSIEGKESSVYVGESLEMQLNILVRPYRNEANRITLSEGQMWQLISDRTDWGIFSERMEEIAQNRQRPMGREVTRDDDEGHPQRYYLYTIDATIYPQSPGTIDAKGCRIVLNYPTGIGRRRSPFAEMFEDDGFPSSRFFDDAFSNFGSRLRITSARPIVAEASVKPIEVKPIPEAGRPDDYRGAVGRYRMVAQAKPSTAKVGDPITLHLVVAGDGPMDLVQAPPLAELSALTADFKVANEPLAGLVEGETKLFSTTIRPRSPDVQEIPSIPFSFFDPQLEQFVTVSSDPIPVTVEAAETMSLDKVVGHDRGQGESSPQGDSDAGASLSAAVDAIYPVRPLLASQQAPLPVRSLDRWLLVLPPLAILLFLLIARRDRLAGWIERVSPADRQFRKRLDRAESPHHVQAALLRWIARKTHTKPASESTAIGTLRRLGKRELAIGCEQIFDRCRRAEAGVMTDEGLQINRLKADAAQLIPQWEPGVGDAGNDRSIKASKRRQPVSAGLLLLAIAGMSSLHPVRAAEVSSLTLNAEQRRLLLGEAVELHQQAIASRRERPAESREQAERAVEKYQTVVEGGTVNAALFFNMAGAEYYAGRKGLAIAGYRRALKLDPDDDHALDALRHVQRTLAVADEEEFSLAPLTASAISTSAVQLTRWIPAAWLRYLAFAAWFMLWLVVGLRLLRWIFPWKLLAGTAFLVAVSSAAIYIMHREYWTRDNVAIVIQPELTLRSGDGKSYAPVTEHPNSEGMAVQIVTARNGWAKVKLDESTSGWVPASSLTAI